MPQPGLFAQGIFQVAAQTAGIEKHRRRTEFEIGPELFGRTGMMAYAVSVNQSMLVTGSGR